jgi:hypothetical protein
VQRTDDAFGEQGAQALGCINNCLKRRRVNVPEQEAELKDLKPRLESKQVVWITRSGALGRHSLISAQEAVEELLTKQRGDIKLLREAEAKANDLRQLIVSFQPIF